VIRLGVTLLQLEQPDPFVTPLNALKKLRDAKKLDPHRRAWHDVIQTCLEYQTDAAEIDEAVTRDVYWQVLVPLPLELKPV
jgi:hypothetical protein